MMHTLNALEALSILVLSQRRLLSRFDIPDFSVPAQFRLHTLSGPSHLALTLTLTPAFLVGTLLIVLGGLLRVAAYRSLGRDFTYQLGLRADHALVTHGLYAHVRHPSYTAIFLVFAGGCLSQLGPGSVLEAACKQGWEAAWVCAAVYAAIVVYMAVSFVQRTGVEDAVLRGKYGEVWEQWAERTRYRLVPYVY